MAAPALDRTFRVAPYSYAEARALARALGVSDPVAITLVRRGYRTVEAAREFLEASESHDPFEFAGMEEACERILTAVGTGRLITVHGDYDVDGVSSTVILVGTLRELGARCDWFIPDRLSDGYGLAEAGMARLAARGTGLLVTADCGITATREVEAARAAGVEVIVTDHHAPAEELPECPIVHPRVCGYPCPDLCGAGVAYKLSAALRERAGRGAATADADLDLVGLATVADLVPLTGENRALVRRSLAEVRRARRPGLRALMSAAGVEPSRVDEGDLAFRLAPRINAAGRLYRADAGVELMLSSDVARAAEIADELDRANQERRDAEIGVVAEAEAALGELPEGPEAPALVVAGAGWHPGVIGIVASRLAERYWRPTVVISLDRDGTGRGSGRSIPAFDLLSALRECGEHLVRFGGHRAAAGLEIEASRLEEFRHALADCASRIPPADLVRTETVDAVVGGDRLGLETAEELERLGPFGIGNPGIRLLVPAARMRHVRPMGDGKHARFSIESGSARALGVAFGSTDGSLASVNDAPVDLSVRLEVNQWNGAVEPRLVLKDLYTTRNSGAGGCVAPARGEEWWERVGAERSAELERWPSAGLGEAYPGGAAGRERVEHPGGSGIAVLAELASSGAAVLALCADAARRSALTDRADPRRFGFGAATHACARCGDADAEGGMRAVLQEGSGLVLADWAAAARHPELVRRFEHAVLIDPPPFAHLEALALAGRGYLHLAWGEAELEFARRVHGAEWELRQALSGIYRALRDRGGARRGDDLVAVLAGDGAHPRAPEVAGRCLRVLEELELVAWKPGLPGAETGGGRALRVVSSQGTELNRSPAYIVYRARHEEGTRFLSSRQRARAA